MSLSRRRFLAAASGLVPLGMIPMVIPRSPSFARPPDRFDPWLEVDGAALQANAEEVAVASGGRPLLAVVKNNGYGLGIEQVGAALDSSDPVYGLAVVKVDEAHRLRDSGVRKPILFMGFASEADQEELARREVRLAPFSDADAAWLPRLGRRLGEPVPVHLYLDTGMGRLGMPYHRALPWIGELTSSPEVRVEGMFQAFTENRDFDAEQLARFQEVADAAGMRGYRTGYHHAAASHAITHFPEALLHMVRPGLMLYGAHVAGARDLAVAELRPAMRLRCRVVRVEELRPGDSVSYGRNYVAERTTWVAALPVGHADGYPRQAVQGGRVLIGGATYPVIGAVSASHTIVEVGSARRVSVGEVATLLGPDHPDIHPNTISERTGRSVYDILMHLSPGLPRQAFS